MRTELQHVVIVGHFVALLPVASFVWMLFWFRHCTFDPEFLSVTGPAWVLRWGGESTGLLGIPLSMICGSACLLLGLISRKWITVAEGVWACSAACILWALYLISLW